MPHYGPQPLNQITRTIIDMPKLIPLTHTYIAG